MNWNKAKNYTIIFLLLMNICLLGLNLMKLYSDRLSKAELSNISKVLDDNGITVEAEIPRGSRSLSQLELEQDSFDLFELVSVFFGSDTDVKRTEEFNVTIFKSGSKSLRVKERTVIYNDTEKYTAAASEARSTAAEYIEKLDRLFPGFVYEGTYTEGSSIAVEYDMYYKDNNCFNNSCEFYFDEKEGMTVTINYLEPLGFSGVKSELYNADIILFSFMNSIREYYPDERLTVTELQLGYFADLKNEPGGASALPYYRIKVRENNDTYYVNGYNANFTAVFNRRQVSPPPL